MARRIDDFLTSYLEYTKVQESPESFHLWTALALIGACLQQRCWVNRQQYKLYPNIMVVLVADSGICRKSTAIDMGEGIMRDMGPSMPLLLPQRATPEGLVLLLKDNARDEPIYKCKVSGGIIFASELDTLFAGDERRKRHLITILTDWHTVPPERDTFTITRKHDIIRYPCISLLGASTMKWLRQIVGEHGVGGGFASRVYFIHEETTDRYVPNPERDGVLAQHLSDDLARITDYSGSWKLAPDTEEWFLNYYRRCYERAFTCDKFIQGFASRKTDHLMRIALLLAVSEGIDDYQLHLEQLERANAILTTFEVNLEAIYDDMLTTADGSIRRDVLDFIRKQGETGRATIIRKFHRRLNARQLDDFMATLIAANLVDEVIGRASTKYRITEGGGK